MRSLAPLIIAPWLVLTLLAAPLAAAAAPDATTSITCDPMTFTFREDHECDASASTGNGTNANLNATNGRHFQSGTIKPALTVADPAGNGTPLVDVTGSVERHFTIGTIKPSLTVNATGAAGDLVGDPSLTCGAEGRTENATADGHCDGQAAGRSIKIGAIKPST